MIIIEKSGPGLKFYQLLKFTTANMMKKYDRKSYTGQHLRTGIVMNISNLS